MKEIESLKNEELLANMVSLSADERCAVAEVVLYLHHLDKRGLFRDAGYGSLFSYCTQKLKYSEGAACRRIAAARALNATPELYSLFKEGKMTLCAVSLLSKVITDENKREILKEAEGKSKLQVQRIVSDFGQVELPSKEKIRAKKVHVSSSQDLFTETPTKREEKRYSVTLELTEREMEFVQEARKMLGKGEIKDVLLKGAAALGKQKKPRTPKVTATVAVTSKKQSRYIPASIQREVRQRDGNQCTYCSPDGKRCSERYRLQIDHIKPFALGGTHEADNLRLLCRAHNSLFAERVFGREKILSFHNRRVSA